MNTKVQAWLDADRPYDEGIQLLQAAGQNKLAAKLLGRSLSPWHKSALYTALTKLPADAIPEVQAPTAPLTQQVAVVSEHIKGLHKEQTAAHSKMKYAKTDEARLEAATRVMDAQADLDAAYAKKEAAKKGKVVSIEAVKEVKADAAAELKAHQAKLQKRSKLKAKLKKGSQKAHLVKKWEQELAKLEAELGGEENR